jgi:hypothetical protein
MNDLIEALTIMRKYSSPQFPTQCEHGVLYVMVDPLLVSPEDLTRLKELSFRQDEDSFYSSRFGGR